MKTTINIARVFSDRLVNRNKYQGDGKHSAIEFREKFLADLESIDWWKNPQNEIILDFSGVRTLGPSWANEAFAYFTKFGLSPTEILRHLILREISPIKKDTILKELQSGYAIQ